MITGRLDYPFALVSPVPPDASTNLDFTETRPVEVDVRGSRIVGELAVHRESLTRILQENPQSLSGVLEALIAALGGSSPVPRPPQLQGQEEETEELALTHA
jgi:hypothetical protein